MSITSLSGFGAPTGLGSYSAARVSETDVQVVSDKPFAETDQPRAKEVRQAVESLNRVIASSQQSIHFTMDEEDGKIVVKVLDSETQKVLRQIPNSEAIAISKNLARLQGLLFSERA